MRSRFFLTHQGRRHQLRSVWIASGAAAALCIVVTVVLRLVEVNLSSLAEQRFEAVVGAVAVLTVTYMSCGCAASRRTS